MIIFEEIVSMLVFELAFSFSFIDFEVMSVVIEFLFVVELVFVRIAILLI